MSSPIRVGLVGLGKGTANNVPGLWGSTAHFPFLLASPAYTVTAICNSSAASAQSAIDFHGLGPGVKAYGSPADLAADPDVDLVVVSVRVGMHYKLAKPALEAGKDVFVEWPLGASLAESEELTKLADRKGVKTIVGLQARACPLVVRLKELVGEEGRGKIGAVVSSTLVGSFGGLAIWGRRTWSAAAEYYLDMNSGGNTFYIFFGHFLDSFAHVLGTFTEDLHAAMKTTYSDVDIVDSDGKVIKKGVKKTSPDQIVVSGSLESGALASLSYRMAPGLSVDGVGVRWIITGTEGEIEVLVPDGPMWQMGPPHVTLKIRLEGKETEVIEWEKEADELEVQEVRERVYPEKNTARIYQAFLEAREGKEGKEWEKVREKYPDFGDALATHKLLERIRVAAGF